MSGSYGLLLANNLILCVLLNQVISIQILLKRTSPWLNTIELILPWDEDGKSFSMDEVIVS